MFLIGEKYEHIRAHNQVSNDRVQSTLKQNHQCLLIQATGTGKTYHVYQIIHDMCNDKWTGSSEISILIIVPTTELVHNWDKHLKANGGFYKSLQSVMEAISSTSVKHTVGDFTIAYKYGITTYVGLALQCGVSKDDIENEKKIVLKGNHKSKIKEIMGKYDLIIFDEAHHLGACTYKPIAEEMLNSTNSSTYIMGMTATSGRLDDFDVASLFAGTTIHGVTRSEAQDGDYEYYDDEGNIVRGGQEGILPHTETLCSLVFDLRVAVCRAVKRFYVDWIKAFDPFKAHNYREAVKKKEQMLSDIEDIFNMLSIDEYRKYVHAHLLKKSPQRIICFYQRGENIEQLKSFLKDVFNISKIVDIHSDYTSSKNKKALDDFENSTEDIIILAIDKLNEGIHIGGVTALIMIRRTFSGVIYNQQIGRAMDFGNRKLTIPVFDLVGNTAIHNDMQDGTPDELEQFAADIKQTEKFAPHFKEAMDRLSAIAKYLRDNKTERPSMASLEGGSHTLAKKAASFLGQLSRHPNFPERGDLDDVIQVFKEIFEFKAKSGDPLTVEMFKREDFANALLLKPPKGNDPMLVYYLERYAKKNGNFESLEDVIEFCTQNLSIPKNQKKKIVEIVNKFLKKYVNVTEGELRRFYTQLCLEGETILDLLLY